MIVREQYNEQGLGNQLWVYGASSSIAEQLNMPFVPLGAERYKGKCFLRIAIEVGISAAEAVDVAKCACWSHFHEALFYDRDLDCSSSAAIHFGEVNICLGRAREGFLWRAVHAD